MKIRLHDGSVRLRLSVSEVATVAAGQGVEVITRFPDGSRLGCLLALGTGPEPGVRFVEGRLEVTVPRAIGIAWAEGEAITMEWQLEVPDRSLKLLIEKDLPCSHRSSSVPDINEESS